MEELLIIIFTIGFFILLLVIAFVGVNYLIRYLLCGFKEIWGIAGKLGPLGHGLVIAFWGFFFPIALVVTLITGWSKLKSEPSSNRQSVHAERTSQYDHVLRMGVPVTSAPSAPYEINLYPGTKVSLPQGEWIIVRERDFAESYGTVFFNALLNGDKEFVSKFQQHRPSYIWIVSRDDPPNFLQITVVDSRCDDPVTPANLWETTNFLKDYHGKDKELESYTLELRELNLPGWHKSCLVEEKRYVEDGYRSHSFCISLQGNPFTVVLSATCSPQSTERYVELTLQMAKTYLSQRP